MARDLEKRGPDKRGLTVHTTPHMGSGVVGVTLHLQDYNLEPGISWGIALLSIP